MPSVDFKGQTFRLADKPNRYAWNRFMALAKRGENLPEDEAASVLMGLLEKCLHPDDWARFDALCLDVDPEWDTDLMPVVAECYGLTLDRPTVQSSDSSAGLLTTGPRSTDDSSSPAMRLVPSGRADLAQFIEMAQRSA